MRVYPSYHKHFFLCFAKYNNILISFDKFIIRWAKTNNTKKKYKHYENKSKEDLIKALSKPKPKLKPKPKPKPKIIIKKEEVRRN